MLGRLRLTVGEAIEQYRRLAKPVFSGKQIPIKGSLFQASKLEDANKGVVEAKLGSGHAEGKMFTPLNSRRFCRT